MQREVLDQPALRRVGKADVLDVHLAAHVLQRLRVGRVRLLRRLVDQLKDAARARQRVLQLRDDAGDLVERLGVLVRVGEEARQPADGQRPADDAQRARQAHTRIHQRVDEACARVGQRGEEHCPQRAGAQPLVDLVKLLERARLMTECLHQLLLADDLVDERGLLAARLRLQAEHGIGAAGDEVGHQQRHRRDQHHHQRDARAERQHEYERAQNRDQAGEQLRKAHEQAVGERVRVGDHPADRVAGGMRVQIRQRQRLNVRKRIAADVLHGQEGDPVVDDVHDPLRGGCQQHAYADGEQHGAQRVKIDRADAEETIDRPAHEDRDVERQRDGDQR